MIAEYLGWKTVAASGARDFHKGDIVSDEWLGECKTHMKEVERYTFDYAVYQKVADEAMSKFKKPILFVDDGTQKIESTYVLVSEKHIPEITFNCMDLGTKFLKKNIHLHKSYIYDNLYDGYRFLGWNDVGDMLMFRLDKFKIILEGNY